MGKQDELDKLTKSIMDADISLKTIEAKVILLEKEIISLEPRKLELETNIEFHKKAEIIPIAQEYKRTKTELNKIKARLALIKPDYKKSVQACKDIVKIIEKFKRDQNALLNIGENNVLRPAFGAKNGKK